jgi:hypothetical protein
MTKRKRNNKLQESSSKRQKKSAKRQKKGKQKKPIEKKENCRFYTRCSVKYIYDMLYGGQDNLLEKMSKKQVKAVRATPFGHFLDSPNVRISTKCIKAILYKWDTGRQGLTIAGNFLELTAEDLSVVLASPVTGKMCNGTV